MILRPAISKVAPKMHRLAAVELFELGRETASRHPQRRHRDGCEHAGIDAVMRLKSKFVS